jgi:hypothetical protein
MYEAETGNASHETTVTTRHYLIEAPSLQQAKRKVVDDLKRLGGETWPDHLAIARGDDPT